MAHPRDLSVDRTPDATLVVRLAGAWRLHSGLPSVAVVERELGTTPPPRRLRFDAAALEEWDSGVKRARPGARQLGAEIADRLRRVHDTPTEPGRLTPSPAPR